MSYDKTKESSTKNSGSIGVDALVRVPGVHYIELSDAQMDVIKDIVEYSNKQRSLGLTGSIIAQPHEKNSTLAVGFVEHEYAKQLVDLLTKARKEGKAT